MKKFIVYVIAAFSFTTENLFAQNVTVDAGIDMKVYTQWMLAGVITLIFVILAILMFDASKELPEDEMQAIEAYTQNSINASAAMYLLPSLSLELNRLKILLISALITFFVILFLLIT